MAQRVIRLGRVDSTNNYIKQLAQAGAKHGTVVTARVQTAGRGRQGRSFQSVPGRGIYLSMLLRPEKWPEQLFQLTPVAAQAVCDGVEAVTGSRPGIKWINDLVMGERKICGILTELSLTPEGEPEYIVLGIGINVNQTSEEFAPQLRDIAGSIAMATGRDWDREELQTRVIRCLDLRLERWMEGQADLDGYRQDCITLGREIKLVRGDEVRYGFAEDIDQAFALVVRFPDGHRETVSSGEVSVRGMEGYL